MESGMWIGQVPGQGWLQLSELGLAFLLSALIGIEREIRQKSAGFETYTWGGFWAGGAVFGVCGPPPLSGSRRRLAWHAVQACRSSRSREQGGPLSFWWGFPSFRGGSPQHAVT